MEDAMYVRAIMRVSPIPGGGPAGLPIMRWCYEYGEMCPLVFGAELGSEPCRSLQGN